MAAAMQPCGQRLARASPRLATMPAAFIPYPTMRIDFISDVACPWCAVGLNALERALERIGPAVPVTLVMQPFELNPDMEPEGQDTQSYLTRKYGLSPAQLEANRVNIRERGAEVGFTFGERGRIWNTFNAHRLLHWAGEQGHQRQLKHALLKAYHGEGRNPGAPEVLLEAAVAAGLDAEAAHEVINSDRYAAEVREAEQFWQSRGISAVPSVVINQRHLIQGGQPVEVFEQAMRQIAAAENAP
jgi:predicted DsbA family dithiol-disulfide isomerase